jgi:nicotinate phosphoribosyltransferase
MSTGALFTDQYQLTMAQLYFRLGIADRPARFEHFFRTNPDYDGHQAGYCISAGMRTLVDWIGSARFSPVELEALRQHRRTGGGPLFREDFLTWLADGVDFGKLAVEAIPEGRVVHPQVPLTVVEGPLATAQLLETPLLAHLNFQTLVATKASRIVEAARGRPVIDFGLRRAQGFGGIAASRAALIGGAVASSNVGISHQVGILPRGTHAHSMVQAFMALGEGELEAFRSYAEVYPDDCLLLVDTIDTLESGVPNAITVFEELRSKGYEPLGIRLDSGDLAHLAVQSARLLDRAGFADTTIVISSQLDEITIWQILNQIAQEAPRYGLEADRLIGRLVFGVGTRMVTSEGAPSLDGVYKLVAVQSGQEWLPAIKVSDSPDKVVNPARKRVWRVYDERGKATADLLALADEKPEPPLDLRHPSQPGVHRRLSEERVTALEELLSPVAIPDQRPQHWVIEEAGRHRLADLERLDPGVRRLVNPHVYHVSLSADLWHLKQDLVEAAER